MIKSKLARRDYWCLALLCALWVIVVMNHELGHDEAQAWNIARSSTYWWEVIWHSRYEGHTPFWFAVLWPLTKTANPLFMQILSIVLSVTVATLLLRDKIFSIPVTIAILIGYFIGYEYAILPRPYIVALVLCALFASTLARSGSSAFLKLSLLCALLGFTSAFGAALSAALMAMLLIDILIKRTDARPSTAAVVSGLSIYLVIVVLAVYFVVWPIEGRNYETTVLTGERVILMNWSNAMETAVFPHIDRLPFGIGHWLTSNPLGASLTLLLSLGASIAILLFVIDRPAAAAGWLLALLLLTAAALISGSRSERHMGHLFMAALVFIWSRHGLSDWTTLRNYAVPKRLNINWSSRLPRVQRTAGIYLTMILSYQALVGTGAMAMDVNRALTPWDAATRYLTDNEKEPFRLITDHAYSAGALLAHLDIVPYNIRCQCFTRYGRWQGSSIPDSEKEYGDMLVKAWCELSKEGERVLLLRTREHWPIDSPFEPLVELPRGYRDASHVPPVIYQAKDTASNLCN